MLAIRTQRLPEQILYAHAPSVYKRTGSCDSALELLCRFRWVECLLCRQCREAPTTMVQVLSTTGAEGAFLLVHSIPTSRACVEE